MVQEWADDLLKLSGDFSLPEMTDKENAWIRFSEKVYQVAPSHPPIVDKYFAYRAAASFLLIATMYYLVNFAFVKEFIAESGKITEVLLPDRSKVMLSAGSSLKFNPVTWDVDRKVQFEGEGFFEIKKGLPLEISSSKGRTEVFGTSININTRDDNYEVLCFVGAVEVLSYETKQILKPGDRFHANSKGLISKSEFTKERAASWLRGEFYFESQPAKQVFRELERQFNVRISHPDLSDRVYSGYFSDEDLHQALEMVCSPLGLTYHQAAGGRIIVKKPDGV